MKEINLHARQKKILSILNAKHGICTGKEISSKIGVSERTIRSDISQMNESLAEYDIQIIPIHGKGYSLSLKDRAAFLELFSEKESIMTKEDRVRTLILRLLREDSWSDVGDLEDEMYVSHTTLEKDIKAIKRKISTQHPFLKVIRKGNNIRLEDDERKKRDLFTRFFAENWDYDSKEGIILAEDGPGADTLKDIQQVLKKRLIESRLFLDDYAFIYLTLAIYVLYYRVELGHYVVSDMKEEDLVLDQDIKSVLDTLNEQWKLELTAFEYEYMSRIKEQLAFLSERTYSKNYVLAKTDISCHQIVNEILEELLTEYGIDFTTDDKLFVDLDRHVQAIKNGIVATTVQNHVRGDELRKKYPFLADIAHTLSRKIGHKCGVEFGIEEEDYLLPFLILAEEELYKKRRGKGIPTAVISHYNESMTHYLMELLKRYYGDVLDLHGPYAIYAKALIDQENTMLVLTTVQIQAFDQLFKTPVLTVSPLLEQADQQSIDLYLTSLKSTYLYKCPDEKMGYYFRENLIYKMAEKNNLTAVFTEMHSRFKEELGDHAPKPNLEKDYYCSLSNGFLFCYQINDSFRDTVVSLVDIGKDTSCKYVRNVRTVMYMIMPSHQRDTLGWFYYMAIALSKNPEELKKVFEGTSIEELTINISKNISR